MVVVEFILKSTTPSLPLSRRMTTFAGIAQDTGAATDELNLQYDVVGEWIFEFPYISIYATQSGYHRALL